MRDAIAMRNPRVHTSARARAYSRVLSRIRATLIFRSNDTRPNVTSFNLQVFKENKKEENHAPLIGGMTIPAIVPRANISVNFQVCTTIRDGKLNAPNEARWQPYEL